MYSLQEALLYIHMEGNVVRREVPDFDIFGKVVIKDWAYIGSHAQIMPGVTIGEGAMVAAGSIAIKSVPDGMGGGGNPTRLLCPFDEFFKRNEKYNMHTKDLDEKEKKQRLSTADENLFLKK